MERVSERDMGGAARSVAAGRRHPSKCRQQRCETCGAERAANRVAVGLQHRGGDDENRGSDEDLLSGAPAALSQWSPPLLLAGCHACRLSPSLVLTVRLRCRGLQWSEPVSAAAARARSQASRAALACLLACRASTPRPVATHTTTPSGTTQRYCTLQTLERYAGQGKEGQRL